MSLIINAKDFHSIHYSMVIINETSGLENRDVKHYSLEELDSTGVKLKIPGSICQKGHVLGVIFFRGKRVKIPKKIPASRQGGEIFFSAIGKVKEKFIDDDSDQVIIEVQFTQFDNHTWQSMLEEYAEKKSQVRELFKGMRLNHD